MMTPEATSKADGATLTVHIALKFRRRGGKKLVVVPDDAPQPSRRAQEESPLVKVLVRAFHWKWMIETGEYTTLTELAAAEHVDNSYLSKVLRLTLLAPDIVEAILDRTSACDLQIEQVLQPFPMEWERQRRPVASSSMFEVNRTADASTQPGNRPKLNPKQPSALLRECPVARS